MTTMGTLPRLGPDYAVAEDRVAAFRSHGHVVTRDVLTQGELEPCRAVIAGAVDARREIAKGGVYQKPMQERKTYDKAFLQMVNLWEEDDGVAAFALARRFGRIAADLLGVDKVRLYHDQALFKEPGGGFTPWHQDQYYWPLSTNNTLTMWMPLVDAGVEMGTLTFASGLHRAELMANLQISDDSEAVYRQLIREKNVPLATSELMAGDATWHHGWTPHKAPGNATDRMREVMTIIFYEAEAMITPLRNSNQKSDLERWYPGCKPGDAAISRLTPIVFDYNQDG